MVECIAAWCCLVAGFVSHDPLYFAASGAFAIATQLDRIINRMDGKI